MKLSQTRIAALLVILVSITSGCGVIYRIRAKNQLNEAARAYREGKFQEAEDHSRRAAELDPDNKNAPMFIARTIHAQYRPVAQSPENIKKAEDTIKAYKKLLANNPKDDESYKAVAYLYGAVNADDKRREWIAARGADENAEPTKRAEAYIVLTSKDWDCSLKITELTTNKTTTVDQATNKATVSYKEPKDRKDFD